MAEACFWACLDRRCFPVSLSLVKLQSQEAMAIVNVTQILSVLIRVHANTNFHHVVSWLLKMFRTSTKFL
jgi:hypothetical protein